MIEGRSVGMFALPDLVIFGYLFPIIAPLADLLFFYFLYDLISGSWSGDLRDAPQAPSYLFLGYLALPLMDLATSFTAICLDRREGFTQMLLFPFQRLFYRQLLYFSVFRAMLRALTGKLAKWNKGERAGFVAVQRARVR